MTHKEAPSFYARIYASGPIDVAKQTIRQECLREGLCVTIEPTIFLYTGGEENGYVVGLLNYPRFPSTPSELFERARDLALKLLDATHQHSVLVVTSFTTIWFTRREQ